MRKLLAYFFILIFVFGSIGLAKTNDESPAAPEAKQSKTVEPKKKVDTKKEEEKRAALRKATEEKKAELNGTSWDVEIKSTSGKGILSGKDTLTFQDERFHSQKAEKNDYSETNYTLTVQETGPTIWETMQTSSKGEVTFWRGEWKEDSMSGVISRQLKEGNEEYFFSSSAKKGISKSSAKPAAEVEEKTNSSVDAPVLGSAKTIKTTETMESKKEKKGWFS